MLDATSYELINRCSTFVLFDLIRSAGGRETTMIDYSNRSCTHPTSSKYTTESVKESYDNDTKV